MTVREPSVDRLLAELREIAERPLEEATGMPPGVYLSEDMLRLEKERIFAKEWLCVGLANEIASAGDYLTYAINDQPIVVMRGKDGAIHGFANVCRHRMMRLLEGDGHCQKIVCPYHGWTYDLDGRLRGAPHMAEKPGFCLSDHRLPEVRTEEWEGWIYATLDPEADSIADRLKPLRAVIARYGMADYVPVIRQDQLWNTNWKLLTENFMECYHLPYSHRETVGAWFPADGAVFPEESHPAFAYQLMAKTPEADYGVASPDNTVLEGKWRHTAIMPTVFPSHMYSIAPDHLWYLALHPEGVGQVRVRFGVAIAPEVMAAKADPDGFVAETEAFLDKVNAEDRHIVEAIFQAAKGAATRAGQLSWLEREIHEFIQYLDRRLSVDAAAAPSWRGPKDFYSQETEPWHRRKSAGG